MTWWTHVRNAVYTRRAIDDDLAASLSLALRSLLFSHQCHSDPLGSTPPPTTTKTPSFIHLMQYGCANQCRPDGLTYDQLTTPSSFRPPSTPPIQPTKSTLFNSPSTWKNSSHKNQCASTTSCQSAKLFWKAIPTTPWKIKFRYYFPCSSSHLLVEQFFLFCLFLFAFRRSQEIGFFVCKNKKKGALCSSFCLTSFSRKRSSAQDWRANDFLWFDLSNLWGILSSLCLFAHFFFPSHQQL